MRAEIITIGNEILIGQIVDTNSAWIACQLNDIGIEIYRINSIGDDKNEIIDAIKHAEQSSDLIIITGGLGPTKDDITKQTLCDYFDTRTVLHQPTLDFIKERFFKRNIPVNQLNRKQAMQPKKCTVLPNKMGTAPGMWFEKDDKIIVSIPGVPYEMQYLVAHEIVPRILQHWNISAQIYHKTILTQGLPESVLAEQIEDWENNLPKNIQLAYLPASMMVRLRLTARGTDRRQLVDEVETAIEKLKNVIPKYIFGYDDETLSENIGKLLAADNRTLAVAESCTGGHISHLITLTAGCSKFYKGGVTAYANTIKISNLGVENAVLEAHGAVSKQVALQMATGIQKRFTTDYAIATTGIAGPSGGTREKPVGTVWIAIATPNYTFAKKFTFGDNRQQNIERTALTALQLLQQTIVENKKIN